ncbi:hypothetical protein BHM03_00058376 [Ensete ventricosum]|nr:hypothetical protein BHM03_00058376 [Ensete ventricosum]
MASEEATDAKLEAFGNHMEEKMRSLFAKFSIGRLSNPRKSQHRETSDHRDDPQEYGYITFDLNNPCMKVDFPRWEEGDPIEWISRTKRYFQFYLTANATRAQKPYTLMAAISVVRIQEEQLIRDELRERSTKELCWHCDEPWSREHYCKKSQFLMIEPAKDEDNETSEEALEPKEEAMEEESQPANYPVHALAGYSNPQMMKVGGLLKEQLITVIINTGSTNNFLDNKVAAHLVLQIKGCNNFDVKVATVESLIATNGARG